MVFHSKDMRTCAVLSGAVDVQEQFYDFGAQGWVQGGRQMKHGGWLSLSYSSKALDCVFLQFIWVADGESLWEW